MKFTLLLTKIAKLHQNDDKMITSIKKFLETFSEHLERSEESLKLKNSLTHVLENAAVFIKI